ncbi:MAG: FAD-dependent oxidoreductase [Selenomonadaceae bacterium]|nr:FAD-dependent oxidoreductase [Selenomonadaceae bacterium]
MEYVHTLIIGAGVSGLTYALHAKGEYLIFDKDVRPGGLCKTFYQDGSIWDYAGHFFHFAHPWLKKYFSDAIGIDSMVTCAKNTNINYYGRLIDYPFQMNIHQLAKDEFIDCLYDLFHRPKGARQGSFQEMLYQKFGKGITEKFLKPYNEKLYACDLNELDVDAMGRFFPYASPEEIIDNFKDANVATYNSVFNYPKRGAEVFVDALLQGINKERLRCEQALERVDIRDKVALIDGKEFRYEQLISTIPLNRFIKLVYKNGAPFVAEEKAPILTANQVLVFNLGYDRPALDTNVHWTYYPDKKINFYRVGCYSNILNTNRLSLYVEIGAKETEKLDINAQLELTQHWLKHVGIISEHQLIAYNALIINPAYVHITNKGKKFVEALADTLQEYDVHLLGRYGKWTYCSIEDCMVDAMGLANKG